MPAAQIQPLTESPSDYAGCSPEPPDLRAFWSESLSELERIAPNDRLEEAAFRHPACRAYELWFRGIGGARLHAKVLRPARATRPGPALLLFHGYTADSGDWVSKLPWVAAGFTVAALDCRGQGGESDDPGGSSGPTLGGHLVRGLADGPRGLAFRAHFLDAARFLSLVRFMDGVDPARVAVMGGSQGAALAVAAAALRPGVAKLLVTYPFLGDFKGVWDSGAREGAYGELWEHLRRRDPLGRSLTALFHTLSYIDLQNLAPWVQADTLFALSLQDRLCPPSSQMAVYNRLRCPKRLLAYPFHGHESLPGWDDHAWDFLRPLAEPQGA